MQNKHDETDFNNLFFGAIFRGRCSRMDYVAFHLTHLTGCFFVSVIACGMGFNVIDAVGCYQLIIFLPMLSVFIRRMHDIGVSGWISIIPLVTMVFGMRLFLRDDPGEDSSLGYFISSGVSLLLFIIAIFKRGVVGDNIYGRNPCDSGSKSA